MTKDELKISKHLNTLVYSNLIAHMKKHPEDLEFYKGDYIAECINAMYDSDAESLVKLGILRHYIDENSLPEHDEEEGGEIL